MESKTVFKASIFSGSEILDTSKIQTAGQYITLHQIIRPLTQLNKQAQISSNAVKSWKVSLDGKTYNLILDENLKWSDGKNISIDDVIKSINRQIKLNTSNHFDFSSIKEVTKINEREFRIVLSKKNKNLIRQMSYPEFGIVDIKDDGSINLKKSSGAYSLEETGHDYFILRKNIFFPYHSSFSPEEVRIEWGNSEDKRSKSLRDELDFFIPFSDFDKQTLSNLLNTKYTAVTPHIGYSFWLTLNPKSTNLKNEKLRERIQLILKKTTIDYEDSKPFWTQADQIYLPDGPGRLFSNEINEVWRNKFSHFEDRPEQNLKLNLLLDKSYPFSKNILEQLQKYGIKADVEWILPGETLFDKMKGKTFDVIQARNDFSSIDLHENLQTTFNEVNALIITSNQDGQYRTDLKDALSLDSIEERSDIYKKIAKDILIKSYVVPLSYHKVLFVHKKSFNINSWSTLYPEISLWKIQSN